MHIFNCNAISDVKVMKLLIYLITDKQKMFIFSACFFFLTIFGTLILYFTILRILVQLDIVLLGVIGQLNVNIRINHILILYG